MSGVLRLDGGAGDRARLATLLTVWPEAFGASWRVYVGDDDARYLVLPRETWPALGARGVSLWEFSPGSADGSPSMAPAVDSGRLLGPAGEAVLVRSAYEATGLLAAIPLQASPPCLEDDALFAAASTSSAGTAGNAGTARRLMERLLHLERSDAQVGTLQFTTSNGPAGEGSSESMTVVRLRRPPHWLVARAVDGADDDLEVFASSNGTVGGTADGGGHLFQPWGWRHPLTDILEADLRQSGQVGLLRWTPTSVEASANRSPRTLEFHRLPQPFATRALLEVVTPALPASARVMTAEVVPPSQRFSVRLRLTPHPSSSTSPELFVVDAERIDSLQSFLESAAPEDAERVVLGRVADPGGLPSSTDVGRSRYLVRELVRVGATPIGPRLALVLGSRGYVRAVGVEGLYVPPGMALQPIVRRSELRALLGLSVDGVDAAAAAVVDEDADGLTVLELGLLGETPLAQLTQLVLTDRRRRLDELLETAITRFPGVVLADDARPRTPLRVPKAAKKRVRPPPTPVRVSMPRPTAPEVETTAPDRVALQAAEASLQHQVLRSTKADDVINTAVESGLDLAGAWGDLASIKIQLGRDDATQTTATAIFLRPGDGLSDGHAAARGWLSGLRGQGATVGPARGRGVLLELVTLDQLSPAQAIALCAEVLDLVSGANVDDERALEDDLLQQATAMLLRPDLPLPRRLQWSTLLAIARHQEDPIALTRAKEAVLGALNTRGLTEALDLPRFIRVALALGAADGADGGAVDGADGGAVDGDALGAAQKVSRSEQLSTLERAYAQLVPRPQTITDGPDALMKAIFAVGFARVGGRARETLAQVEEEAPVHDAPVQLLLGLYSSRVAWALTRTDDDGADGERWQQEVARLLDRAATPQVRAVAAWLVKRSRWLGSGVPAEPTLGLRPSLQRIVEGVRAGVNAGRGGAVVDGLRDVAEAAGYDYEVAAAAHTVVGLALETGNDDVIGAAAARAFEISGQLRILAHRARLLGSAIGAAAAIGDAAQVEQGLVRVAEIARDPHVPGIRDLLAALRPSLQALRRVGAVSQARRFLEAFEVMEHRPGREVAPLLAALAEGQLLLGDGTAALGLLQRALDRVVDERTPHIDRYEAGAAICGALVHWSHGERFVMAADLLERLTIFGDTFTASRYYPTHQLLMLEHLVECVVDEVTVRGDRLQHYLDDDEASVRARILADWKSDLARFS